MGYYDDGSNAYAAIPNQNVMSDQIQIQQHNHDVIERIDEYEAKYTDLDKKFQSEVAEKSELTKQIQKLQNELDSANEYKSANIKLQQQLNEYEKFKEESQNLQQENAKL